MESTNEGEIYQGNSVISIETFADYSQPVLVKRPAERHPSRRNLRTLENEYQMTRALVGVEGVRKALGQQAIENQPALVLEYIEGQTLQESISGRTLDLRSKLEIAVALARILGEIHQQGVIHLDLNSENVLIESKGQAVHIIDLGAASLIDRSGQQKVRPDQMLGTLPYISPEQTGRINRAVDERSDLYSLGVVLYELLTGQLPFDSKDPLELVHAHIARVPISPSEVSPEIPEVISAIILKLLSKDAEDRYQSATGLRADLEKCLQRLSPKGTIEEFPLGEADYTNRLRFPSKLYGRDRDLKELEIAFESVCQDTASIFFVGGYSGIGKTALVEELLRPVSEEGGYFIQGEFDQLVTTPYAGINQAFALFISQILAQPETQFDVWRSRILEAVGPNGRVLTDVVPSLELLIGPQPAVPDLSGQEAQNRFNYVFQRFCGAIARSEHPICFFLDDLQWIDLGSLGLLKNLFSSPDLAHLLVVGAYRDNEVDEDHPLMVLIADLEKAGANLRRMTLKKLSEADVDALISDLVRRDPGEVRELSRLVYSQTDGNPFFTRQVLRSVEDQDLIALDTATGRWHWDMDAFRDLDVTASVVELLVGKLKKLPADIQETLKVAACMGSQFDIATLTAVTAGDDDATLDHIREAVAAGLIWDRDDRGFFVHDRVQEAAYALVPVEGRDRLHLTIGRLLLQRYRAGDHEQDLYQIVDQLNHGLHLIEDEHEQIQIARLHLQAGRKAKQSFAFSASAEYLKQSASLVDEKTWQERYPLALDVYNEWIEACYFSGQYPEVEVLSNKILEHVEQVVDLRVTYQTMIQMKIGVNELFAAISIADEYLERLQISFDPALDSKLSIDELYNLPAMKDEEKLAALEILVSIITPMGFMATERVPSLIYTMMNTISRYGNCEVSSVVFAWYATLLCTQGNYQEGSDYGLLAENLLRRFPSHGMTIRVMNMQSAWIQPWVSSVHDAITPLEKYGRIGMSQGVLEYASYSLANRITLMWISGAALPFFLTEAEECIRLCQSTKQEVTRLITALLTQAAQNLSEKTAQVPKLEGQWFSEEYMLQSLEGNFFVLTFYWLLKLALSYLFGDPREAYGYIDALLKSRTTLFSHYIYTRISFYGALTCVACLSSVESDVESHGMLEKLELFERELELWAQSAPMNSQHQCDLVKAEKCRATGEHWKATQIYEKAIRGAQENRFVHDEALAHELCGRFWLEQGNDRIAETYMRSAHALYHQWGAAAKVRHLEECYPQWFQTKSILSGEPEYPDGADRLRTTIAQPISPIQLDLDSIISASQLLALETDLEQLLVKMMNLVMHNSGAEKAVLLLRQETGWLVQARSYAEALEHDVLLNFSFDPADSDEEGIVLPVPVFDYCRRTKEVLVVEDAQLDHRFAQDRMIQEHRILSMACVPALSQGQLKAMLYLESRQMAGVFTRENVEILKHLSAQFAVSVENALLYDSLNQLVEERTLDLQKEIVEHKRVEERLQQEVAERKTAERELQAQINLFDTLLETAPDTIEVFDPHTMEYIKWNQACTEITGYSDEEFARMNPAASFFGEADARRVEAAVDQVLREGSTTVAADLIAKDGRRTPMEFLGSLARDAEGKPLFFVSVGRDITERKRAEEALRESEEQYRDLVEKISDVIYSIDAEGVITYLNPAVEELLELSPEQAVGQPFARFIHPEDRERIQGNVQTLLSGGAPGTTEYRVLTAAGETRWIRVTSQPAFDGDRITGLQGLLTDITERKRVEEQLEEAAVAAERQRLARELHDSVTQSLHAANLIAETIPSKWEEDPEEGQRGLAHLQRFSQGALAEMRTLLLELNPAALEDQELPVLLRQLGDAMMARSRALVTTTVTGECALPDEVKVALYRIAQEALNNVIKHSGARVVRINLQCLEALTGARTILSIKDDGYGFDPEDTQPAGLGIGIMRDRAREIDATLSITSQPELGTEVLVDWKDSKQA